ncbi:MAG: aa3-type cytochrome c oxidase subunit IV [Methylobacteriaceae bacterium]|nr:aa3-type cytochrome c oxidase subunit IV [Methylobacteriaceae bacterium]
MADTGGSRVEGYRGDMDGPAHEGTYSSFIHFAAVATVFVAGCVVALAVGGLKGGWISAIVMIVLNVIATGIGLFSPSLSWRPPATVLGLLLLMLLLY